MPADLATQFQALLTKENLAIMVATLVIWAGSHFFGVGEIVDVLLLTIGAFTIGWSITDVAEELYNFVTTAINARSDQDIDRAAKSLARAVVLGGITTIMALLLRRSAHQVQATRGASVGAAIRPREPGLRTVRPDTNPQPGRLWRRATTTRDPTMPAGTGKTNFYGDSWISTKGTATEQQLVRIHELVHSLTMPRLNFLRTYRVRLRKSMRLRSVLLTYLEEALAETVAQTYVYGAGGLLTGLRFPVANGYVTLAAMAAEGAEIGTIVAERSGSPSGSNHPSRPALSASKTFRFGQMNSGAVSMLEFTPANQS
jgi:hypothetical protein